MSSIARSSWGLSKVQQDSVLAGGWCPDRQGPSLTHSTMRHNFSSHTTAHIKLIKRTQRRVSQCDVVLVRTFCVRCLRSTSSSRPAGRRQPHLPEQGGELSYLTQGLRVIGRAPDPSPSFSWKIADQYRFSFRVCLSVQL